MRKQMSGVTWRITVVRERSRRQENEHEKNEQQ